jgi:YidC/Oxa1 family membrane protein insertase
VDFFIEIWNTFIQEPMINTLVVLYSVLFGNFGVAIAVFTMLVRLVMLPLTLRQLRSSKAMSDLQPKIQELQKKYAKSKDKLSQEMMKAYKEAGVNPLGCLGPMVIQLPIWIALYQSVIGVLATTPEQLLNLSQRLYSWPIVYQAIPLKEEFLWLNLARPDPYYVLPVLVGATMWVQQKMVSAPGVDPRQQQMSGMMLWMMPVMFAFFTLQFPSGLAIYWVVSNVVGIIIQYFITGWGYLLPRAPAALPSKTKTPAGRSRKRLT